MTVNFFQLEQFRNHNQRRFSLSLTTIILGPNGAGKTNLIEAIRLLSLGKSFRATNSRAMINWSAPIARVIGQVSWPPQPRLTIECALVENRKYFKINGQPRQPVQAIGQLKTVLFLPDDVTLLTGPPNGRRRFLDQLLVQRQPEYLWSLSQYQRVLKQRNALLLSINQKQASTSELSFWNQELVKHGKVLHRFRQDLVEFIQANLESTYQFFTKTRDRLWLKPQFDLLSEEKLNQALDRDLRFGSTTLGPHRDDWYCLINDRRFDQFGSRGEQRSLVVTLKLLEVRYLTVDNDPPVLLLDDVASEFDHRRRAGIEQLVGGQQTILTTTDRHLISRPLIDCAAVIELP